MNAETEGKRQLRPKITPSKTHYRKGGGKYVRAKASVECQPLDSHNHCNHDLKTGHVHCTTQEWPCQESMEVRRDAQLYPMLNYLLSTDRFWERGHCLHMSAPCWVYPAQTDSSEPPSCRWPLVKLNVRKRLLGKDKDRQGGGRLERIVELSVCIIYVCQRMNFISPHIMYT